jgi:hypothetical protein
MCEGETPSRRYGHASVWVPAKNGSGFGPGLLIHGGLGEDGRMLNDTWFFGGERWQQVAAHQIQELALAPRKVSFASLPLSYTLNILLA